MATTPDDPYAPIERPRRPKPGDPDYVESPIGDPNAPPPPAPPPPPGTPPPGATINPGGNVGWEYTQPTPTPPPGPIPPPPVVPPTSESRRPPKPTAPPTAPNTPTLGYDYVWQEGTPVWDPVNQRYTFPQGTWAWQHPNGPGFVDPNDPINKPAATATTATTGPDAIITRALQQAYGRAPTQTDLDYWRGKWAEWGSKDPAYFEQRLLGMNAGGADAALYGQYSAAQGYRAPEHAAAVTPPQYTLPEMGPQSSSASYSSYASAPTSYTPPPVSPTTAATANTPDVTQGDLDKERNAAILELLQRKPPSYDDLRTSPEASAYMLESQRGAERSRAALAERAATEGFDNTGFFDTELRGQEQQRAEGESGFIGQLAVTKLQQQREDLQFAIDQARNSGQFEQAQALQREAMNLDAAIRREQMGSTERMAANDLALRDFLGRAGLDLQKLSMTQQGQQFLQQLGFNYWSRGLDANAQAALATRPE